MSTLKNLFYFFDNLHEVFITSFPMLNAERYEDRVTQGKLGEQSILNTLRKHGLFITPPTADEDILSKIDGWMGWKGATVAVQVKFRESGDDVLVEVLKDIDKGTVGRDMKCKADYYLVKNRAGRIRMFSVAELKTKVAIFQAAILEDIQRHPSVKHWGNPGAPVNIKLVFDRCHGNRKLIAYFNPEHLTCFGEWQE